MEHFISWHFAGGASEAQHWDRAVVAVASVGCKAVQRYSVDSAMAMQAVHSVPQSLFGLFHGLCRCCLCGKPLPWNACLSKAKVQAWAESA